MVKNVPEVSKRILHRLPERKFWDRALRKFSRLDLERFLPGIEGPKSYLQRWGPRSQLDSQSEKKIGGVGGPSVGPDRRRS